MCGWSSQPVWGPGHSLEISLSLQFDGVSFPTSSKWFIFQQPPIYDTNWVFASIVKNQSGKQFKLNCIWKFKKEDEKKRKNKR